MAKHKDDDADDPAVAEAANKAQAEAEQLDETVEGGRYRVGNEIVDANGDPVGKKK
jgi:hypothetical protein